MSIMAECPKCGLQMWAADGESEALQRMEDAHDVTCGQEGEIDAGEVEDE